MREPVTKTSFSCTFSFFFRIHCFSRRISGDDSAPDETHDGNAKSQLQCFHVLA